MIILNYSDCSGGRRCDEKWLKELDCSKYQSCQTCLSENPYFQIQVYYYLINFLSFSVQVFSALENGQLTASKQDLLEISFC